VSSEDGAALEAHDGYRLDFPTMVSRRSGRSSLAVPSPIVDFLRKRGARPDRAGGPQSQSSRLRKTLDLLEAVLQECDPRKTRSFPDAYHQVILELLADPWSLDAYRIQTLPAFLQTLPNFSAVMASASVDPAKLLAAVEELTFPERLALIDHAELHHASKTTPSE
jgi:hypothetical protein